MNVSNFHPSLDIHVQTQAIVTGMVADKPIEIHYNDCTASGQLPDFMAALWNRADHYIFAL